MTLLVTGYASKKALKEAVGQRLKFSETSMFGSEYKSNGNFAVAHRPSLPQCKAAGGREFFATVTMVEDRIAKVV